MNTTIKTNTMITSIRTLILVIFVLNITSGIAQTTTENYIKTTTYQNEISSDSNADTNDKLETIQYYDGLGRPKQSVQKASSPNQKDIITPITYDAFGRKTKEYLPYEATTTTGVYRASAVNEVQSFYNTTKYENTTNPYSEKLLESSPLGRLLKQAAPGEDWAMGSGHEMEYEYQTNTANEVKRFDVVFENNDTTKPTLVRNGNYSGGMLTKTIIKDENHTNASSKGHTTEEFTDKHGRMILKRTYESEEAHDTYYIYDDYGNLSFVIPPNESDNPNLGGDALATSLESDAIINANESLDLVATDLIILTTGFNAKTGSNFTAIISDDSENDCNNCYKYIYDDRNRLVEKKIPGKDWEYIIYNKVDQPILTQDANLREKGQWLFTKYDAFGRIVYTCLLYTSDAADD